MPLQYSFRVLEVLALCHVTQMKVHRKLHSFCTLSNNRQLLIRLQAPYYYLVVLSFASLAFHICICVVILLATGNEIVYIIAVGNDVIVN